MYNVGFFVIFYGICGFYLMNGGLCLNRLRIVYYNNREDTEYLFKCGFKGLFVPAFDAVVEWQIIWGGLCSGVNVLRLK